MASRSLGTLTLDLVAKIGGFTAGLTKAERDADKSAKAIEQSLKGIGVASLAVGTALGSYLRQGIDAVAGAFPALIEQAGQFQDIAEKTGGSAEGFASLAVSAKVGGASMEELTAASIKLSKSLVGVDDESKAAGAALTAIGVSIEDFKKLSPDQQFLKLADALGQYADGAGKTNVATALLGKNGAALLPVLKDLYEQGGAQKILTDEQIRQADDFADKQTRARAQLGLYASAIATEFLPAATAFTNALKDVAKELTGVGSVADALGGNNGVQVFAENAGRFLAEMVDRVATSVKELRALIDFVESSGKALSQVASFDFSGAAATGAEFRKRYGLDELGRKVQQDSGKAAAKTFVQAYNDQLAASKRSAFAAVDPRRVDAGAGKAKDTRAQIAFQGAVTSGGKKGGGATDDPTKALLDNQIKALSESIEQEKSLFAERNKFLELYNAQGLISVRDFYAQRQNILDEATAAQSKAYDEQAQALRDYIAKAPKETERAAATGKLNDVLANQAKLHRAAGAAAIESSIKQVQAQREVAAAADEVNAKLLEFNGNLREAAAIRFDAQNQKLRDTFTAEGNTQAVKNLDTLRGYTLAQADLNRLQEQFSLAQGSLQIAEERIQIARERGTMGEIQSLRASGDARRVAVGQLREQLAAFQAIDSAARSPAQNQAIERLKVQLEGLEATIDPLADKFNTMLGDAAGNAFSDYINGVKTAKEATTDFLNSITQQLQQMIVKDLGNQLFKGLLGGASGGASAGGFLASLFGGSAGSGAVAGFASGGFTGMGAANDPAGIVHRGEYVLDANTTRRLGVSYLDGLKSGGTGGGIQQTNNFIVPGKLDTRTQSQLTNKLRRETLTASARF